MGKAPAFQFYPGDWIQDTRILTPLTRGVWIDMLCFMWRSEERGTISGSVDQLARLLSCTRQEIETAINELSVTRNADVTKCNDVVTVTNRRMAREEKERKNTRLRVEKHRNKLCNAACNGISNDIVTVPSSSSSSFALESKDSKAAFNELDDLIKILKPEPPDHEDVEREIIMEMAPALVKDITVSIVNQLSLDGFKKAHEWVQGQTHMNARAVLHTLKQCQKYHPANPWAYCDKILKIENGNFNEQEHIRNHS